MFTHYIPILLCLLMGHRRIHDLYHTHLVLFLCYRLLTVFSRLFSGIILVCHSLLFHHFRSSFSSSCKLLWWFCWFVFVSFQGITVLFLLCLCCLFVSISGFFSCFTSAC